MKRDPGAIVLIVYYVLHENGKTKAFFNASFIYREYHRMLEIEEHYRKLTCISERYKKHTKGCLPTTLSSEASINSWLKLHYDMKDILWFEKSNNSYRFKSKYLSRLNEALSVCM